VPKQDQKRPNPLVCFIIFGTLLLAGCNMTVPQLRRVSVPNLAPPAQTITPEHPPLLCKIKDGTAAFQQGWYDFSPAEFTLQSGMKNRATLKRLRKSYITADLWITRAPNNQRLIFCAREDTMGQQCSSIYALEDDFEHGIVRTLDVPDIIRGAVLYCRYTSKKFESF